MNVLLRPASVLAFALAALSASATVLDFEGLAEGNLTTYGGVTFTNAAVLRSDGSLNYTVFPPHSGIGVIYNTATTLTVGFGSAQSSVGAYVTTGRGPVTLQAYSGAAFLGSVVTPFTINVQGSGNTPNYFLSFSGAGITSVRFSDLAGGSTTFDDLTFTANPTPEPSALAALGLGAVALVKRRRKG